MKRGILFRACLLALALVPFIVHRDSVQAAIATQRVSIDTSGFEIPGPSVVPHVPYTGKFVVFKAISNVDAGDTNGVDDIYMRDRIGGTTSRISTDTLGGDPDAPSDAPRMSADGEWVVWHSAATDLVPGDTNGVTDIFIRGPISAGLGSIERISLTSFGGQALLGGSNPSVSEDGRYVAFTSSSPDIVPGDTNAVSDVFIRDRLMGTTIRVSVDTFGTEGNGASGGTLRPPVISGDGQFVVFQSDATNLVLGDTNGAADIFLRGPLHSPPITERVSVSSGGVEGNAESGPAADISIDGRYVAFESFATNLAAGDANLVQDVFLRDMLVGTTILVSRDMTDAATGGTGPLVSDDGSSVVFTSPSPSIVFGDTNGTEDVFFFDVLPEISYRKSVSSSGAQGDGPSRATGMSGDARYIVFESTSTNLVAGDTNGASDAFLHDRCLNDVSDCDGFDDAAPSTHEGPANTNTSVDNCIGFYDTYQANTDGNYIDLSPPKLYDDLSSPNSDAAGDACDADDDNDGRTDADEIAGTGCAATNPLVADTDGDHAIDGAECVLGTDPNNVSIEPSIGACGATTDADGDKVLAFREVCYYGTDPNVANTDGDTRNDGCEVYSINGDLTVNVIDLQQIASESGAYASPGSAVKVDFDVTKNGSIDVIDLQQTAAGDGVCP